MMVVCEPIARFRSGQFLNAIEVLDLLSLGLCLGVVDLQGQESYKVQKRLDLEVCIASITDPFFILTDTLSSISAI